MAKCVIVVDNSNIFIEGQKYSATAKGQQRPDGSVCDPSWRIDFGALLTHLANGRPIHAAVLVGSRPPENDGVWREAQRQGFTVTVHDRDQRGREKAVDTELVAQGTEIIVSAPERMDLIIASGDRDFIPLVSVAHRRGWSVEMAAFSSAFQSTGQMANSVDTIRALDAAIRTVGRNAFDWPIATPAGAA